MRRLSRPPTKSRRVPSELEPSIFGAGNECHGPAHSATTARRGGIDRALLAEDRRLRSSVSGEVSVRFAQLLVGKGRTGGGVPVCPIRPCPGARVPALVCPRCSGWEAGKRMPMTCRVCGHKRRLEIDRALLEGTHLRDIARRTGATASSLQRHEAEHLVRDLVKAHEAGKSPGLIRCPRCADRSGPGGEALWRG